MTCSRATRRHCWSCSCLLAAEPAHSRRARCHDRAGRPAPVAHRRGVPSEPAPSPAVPRHPARAGRRHARAAAHELPTVCSGRYIPAFGRIVGRMQYDLFHALHRRCAHAVRREQPAPPGDAAATTRSCPALSAIAQSLPKLEDRVPRGTVPRHRQGPRRGSLRPRRGRRAKRSASSRACRRYDARLRAPGWCAITSLLSITAQKKDIGDPQVINELRARVGDETHLDYLYVLTVADVRGTNRSCGTPGRPRCSTISTSVRSARCVAAWRARSTRMNWCARRKPAHARYSRNAAPILRRWNASGSPALTCISCVTRRRNRLAHRPPRSARGPG